MALEVESSRGRYARAYALGQDAVAARKISAGAFTFYQLLIRLSREQGEPGIVKSGLRALGKGFGRTPKTLIAYRRQLEKAGLLTYVERWKHGCARGCQFEVPTLAASFFSAPNGGKEYNRDGGKKYNRDGGNNYNALYNDALPTGVVIPQDNVSTSPAGRGHRGESRSAADGLTGGAEAWRRGAAPPMPANGTPRAVRRDEAGRVMKRLRELFGPSEMHRNGGVWRLRLDEDPDGLLGLIGDLEQRIRDGKAPRVRAAWCEKVWRETHRKARPLEFNPVPE